MSYLSISCQTEFPFLIGDGSLCHPPEKGARMSAQKPAHKFAQWGWMLVFLCVLLFLSMIAWPGAGMAQLSDDTTTTSTQGTQFVGEEEKKPAQPPPGDKPPPPDTAAVKAPDPPKPPPPRYPSVIFLVDTSDSMLNKVAGGKLRQLDVAKTALVSVLQGMSRETRVQIWTFNTVLRPVLVKGVPKGRFIPIGRRNNRAALIRQVNSLRTFGGTNLYRSIVKALAFFSNARDQRAYRSGQRFPVLVVLSDGEDGGTTREKLETVEKEKSNYPLVTINTVGFNISENPKWLEILCRIATERQGCATADDGPQLQRMLDSFYRPRTAPG